MKKELMTEIKNLNLFYSAQYFTQNAAFFQKYFKNIIISQILTVKQNSNLILKSKNLINLNQKKSYLYLTGNANYLLKHTVNNSISKKNRFSLIWTILFFILVCVANNQSLHEKVSSVKQRAISKVSNSPNFDNISGGQEENITRNSKVARITNGDGSDNPNNNFWIILIITLLTLGFIGLCLFLFKFYKNYQFLSSEAFRHIRSTQFLENSLLETKEQLITAQNSMISESKKFGEFRNGLNKILLGLRSNLDDLEDHIIDLQSALTEKINGIVKHFDSYISQDEFDEILKNLNDEKANYQAKVDQLYTIVDTLLKRLKKNL